MLFLLMKSELSFSAYKFQYFTNSLIISLPDESNSASCLWRIWKLMSLCCVFAVSPSVPVQHKRGWATRWRLHHHRQAGAQGAPLPAAARQGTPPHTQTHPCRCGTDKHCSPFSLLCSVRQIKRLSLPSPLLCSRVSTLKRKWFWREMSGWTVMFCSEQRSLWLEQEGVGTTRLLCSKWLRALALDVRTWSFSCHRSDPSQAARARLPVFSITAPSNMKAAVQMNV